MAFAVKDNQIQEVDDDEIDVELPTTSRFFSTHVNAIPLQNAVQGPRLFYGARFFNQAVPLVQAEAPVVQNLDPDSGRSFDDILGERMGALRTRRRGIVRQVGPDELTLEDLETGETWQEQLYNSLPFNRKTVFHQTPVVKEGDEVEEGQLLARSNYTDDQGTMSLTVNARVGLVPYKGWSMDDATVISESMAQRLTSTQTYVEDQDFDDNVRGGLQHYTALFPTTYKKVQLEKLDDQGVARPGMTLEKGDPYVLATKPRMFTSQVGSMGKLSRAMRQTRQDASLVWDHEEPGRVLDVAQTKKGVKVVIQTDTPAKVGDKIVQRLGNKGVISKIIPDEHMPRTADGRPLELLMNPLGINSRVNSAMVYEMLLGKIAEKRGEPYKLSAFNQPGEKWYDFVQAQLEEHGLTDKERVFDPQEQRELENPITVGVLPTMKLHHMVDDKISGRSQGAYDDWQQPLKGGSDQAQAKRLSGLEVSALMSSGAYHTLREASTLRGASNDAYWKAIRSGHTPPPVGTPFAWDKFRALLVGSGMLARDLPGGKMRLGPFTDRRLDELKPRQVNNGQSVDPETLEPVPGGLFDPLLVGAGRWGVAELGTHVPNPAFEKQIAQLLGIREKDVERIVAGELTLQEAQA